MTLLAGYGGALLAALLFLALVKVLGLVERSSQVVKISRGSFAILGDPSLDEDAKEASLKRDAVILARLSVLLTFGMAIALALPFCLLWILDRIGIVPLDATVRASMSWQFLLAVTLLILLRLRLDHRRRRGAV